MTTTKVMNSQLQELFKAYLSSGATQKAIEFDLNSIAKVFEANSVE